MRKIVCVFTLCFFIISMLPGCSALQKIGLGESEDLEAYPVSSIAMGEEEAEALAGKVPIHLYFANKENTKLRLEVRYIPVSEAKKTVNNLAKIIVEELIEGPTKDSGLNPTIPVGTKLRSPVKIDGGIATVDLTTEFVDKHPGGKDAEQLTIYSIANSLTELKEIQKVKFLVDGKTRKEYKGNFQFDAPFPRSASLISKDVSKPSSASTDKTKDSEGKDQSEGAGSEKDEEQSKPTDVDIDIEDSEGVQIFNADEETDEILE